MDRYVIKVPQPSSSGNSPSKSGSRMKQATIESLKGVVVVDDILRHKSRLRLETSSKEEKLDSLNELSKKIPPRHVMLSTKIGKVINKLRTHEDEEIKRAAKKVYVKWKTHFVEHMERPMMEVKCDLKTEKVRKSGTDLLAGALSVEVRKGSIPGCSTHPFKQLSLTNGWIILNQSKMSSWRLRKDVAVVLVCEIQKSKKSHKLPETIERETFNFFKRMVSGSYRRTIRHLVFMLKNQADIREKVLSGDITVTDLVKDNKKS